MNVLGRWVSRLLVGCAIATTANLAMAEAGRAQSEPLPRTISVSSFGEAAEPADKALIVVRYTTNFYGEPDPETGIVVRPQVAFSDLRPVVDALIAAGVSESAISSSSDLYTKEMRLIVQMENPTRARLSSAIDAAMKTTIEKGKFTAGTGTLVYGVADCDRAEAAAYERAILSLQRQAGVMANSADVDLGELLSLSTYTSSWGGAFASSQLCPRTMEDLLDAVQYGGQTYDLAAPLEVPVSVSVTATYEIE